MPNVTGTSACAMRAHTRTLPLAIFALLAVFVLAVLASAAFPQSAVAKDPSLYTWKEKKAPNYLVQWGKAKGASTKPKKGKIKYSKLDKYGRTRKAKATLTYKMVKKALDRGKKSIPYDTKPSGWNYNKTIKLTLTDGTKYKGYFWNRSHLIADSLGGSVKQRNLITGTRTQNVGANNDMGGIAFCECLARTWLLRHHKATVYYAVRPVYKGTELVPRSVVVDIQSSDKKLNKRFVVYNAMRGYKINYKTGSFKKIKPAPEKVTWPEPTDETNVYVTPSGARYHRHKLCDGLAYASKVKKTTCGEAEADGRTACALCW